MTKVTKKVEHQDNEQKVEATKLAALLFLNLKVVFNNKTLVWQVLWLFVLALLLPCVLLPYWVSGAAMLDLYLILPLLIIMGNLGYTVRRSTLFNNLHMAGADKVKFHLSNIFTLFLLGNIMSIVFWMIVIMLGWNGLLLSNWAFLGGGRYESFFVLSNGAWINLIYVIQVTILLCFAIYFLIHGFLKNLKTYYITILAIVIIAIIFGGSLNTYFAFPIKSTLTHNPSEHVMFVGGVTYVDQDWWLNGSINDEWSKAWWLENTTDGTIVPNGGLFPNSMFITSLITPAYGVGEFTTSAVGKIGCAQNIWSAQVAVVNHSDFVAASSISDGFSLDMEGIVGQPFLEVNKKTLSNIWQIQFGAKNHQWFWTAMLIQPYVWIVLSFFVGKLGSKFLNN